MALNFLIAPAISFGASALLSLFGSNPRQPPTQREINKLENFDYPNSAYGEPIPDVYGKVRVRGIYVAAQVPPDWERDDYFDAATRENILTYIYYGNLAVLWATNPPLDNGQEVKRIWFNRELYFSNGAVDGILGQYWGRFEGLTVNNYYGEQTSSDAILNFMGSNQIAYHERAYSAMKRLRLNNSDGGLFNSRYPDLEAAIDTHASGATLYLGQVIAKILEQAGYTSDQYDLTELNTIELRGFVAFPSSAADKLRQLQWAYPFEIVDTGSQLKFIKQNRPSSSTAIARNQLGAREGGGDQDDLYTEEIDQEIETLPTQVRVKFSDFNNDYLPGEALSFDVSLSDQRNIEDIDLSNLTLTQSEARAIAERVLKLAWLRRRIVRFTVLPLFCGLEAGDVINVDLRDNETTFLQIKRINHGANGLIQIEAYPYDSTIYDNQFIAPATVGQTVTAIPGTAIALAQQNVSGVSVFAPDGTQYTEGVDYTVNTTLGTVTPIIGGGIPNDGTVNIIYQGQATPAPPPPPLNLPPSPYLGIPRVLGFSPPSGTIGTALTITGENFTGTTAVEIDGTAIDNLVVVSDTAITGDVATGTTTGKVTVTNGAGSADSLTDFVVGGNQVNFSDLLGQPKDNAALGNILTRSLRYTATTSNFTIPAIGGTVTVDVIDSDYIQPTMPLFISIEGYGYCQLVCTSKTGLTLTLTREADGLFSQSFFAAPALVFPMTEAVKVYRFGEVSNALSLPWGNIEGTLSNQTDLQTALNAKFDNPTGTTGQYLDGEGTPQDFAATVIPFGGFIETIANKTYPLFKPDRSYKILSLRVKSGSGTCTWAIQINGVNVTGLSAVSVSSTEQLVTATAANVVASGQRVTIVSTANSSAVDVEFTIMLEVV
ncbi:MAG: hypothetical protein RLZZ490_902 [Cyanobacteriota bacterium]